MYLCVYISRLRVSSLVYLFVGLFSCFRTLLGESRLSTCHAAQCFAFNSVYMYEYVCVCVYDCNAVYFHLRIFISACGNVFWGRRVGVKWCHLLKFWCLAAGVVALPSPFNTLWPHWCGLANDERHKLVRILIIFAQKAKHLALHWQQRCTSTCDRNWLIKIFDCNRQSWKYEKRPQRVSSEFQLTILIITSATWDLINRFLLWHLQWICQASHIVLRSAMITKNERQIYSRETVAWIVE